MKKAILSARHWLYSGLLIGTAHFPYAQVDAMGISGGPATNWSPCQANIMRTNEEANLMPVPMAIALVWVRYKHAPKVAVCKPCNKIKSSWRNKTAGNSIWTGTQNSAYLDFPTRKPPGYAKDSSQNSALFTKTSSPAFVSTCWHQRR